MTTQPHDPAAWHHVPTSEVLQLLGVDVLTGLSSDDVTRRQAEFGPNRVSAGRATPVWLKFLQQFHQPLVYVLLVAGAVTAFLGEWVDSSVIFGVVVIGAVIGFLQENKAEKAIEALAHLVVAETTVRRDGQKQRIRAEEVVPGDVVLLQAGDRVPADLRLHQVRSLHVDESALTGKSLPVPKRPDRLDLDTVLADRRNLAFAGTLVTAGQGEGVVWATGDRTETGRIARLVSTTVDISTPLTRKIAQFSRLLLWLILGLAVVTLIIGLMRGEQAVEMILAAVALAVGAIPEGLPAAVSIVLAIGVGRMAKRQAIIRQLPAVETLGSTTVICSDKTGTLTANQMTVQEIFAGGRFYQVTGSGYEPQGEIRWAGESIQVETHPALVECLRAGVLCNDSHLVRDPSGHRQVQGDPTEAALLVAAEKGGLIHTDTHREWPRLDMIPFESEHMFRATLHDARPDRVIYKVGALERLLDRCTDALGADNTLMALDREAVHRAVDQMASRGLRVLGLARRHLAPDHARLEHDHVSEGLTFVGLQGMMDPPRAEAIAAVRQCQDAGMVVKMITGDHAVTATVIAQQMGFRAGPTATELPVLTGRELEAISDPDLPLMANRTAVFARVPPEQKLRLVHALQSVGHVVAMTGDGVNDAPALKQADIGVAMGLTGTDVAKGAAAMVLTDDNFASIAAAVEEGRGVFDNLTKYILWAIPTNTAQSLIILASVLTGMTLPALPVQLLWVNLTTAIFLGLPLAFEPKEPGLMSRLPRDPRKPMLSFALLMRTGLVSLIILLGAFGLFRWEHGASGRNLEEARTAVANVVIVVEAFYLLNARSLTRTVFSVGVFSNRWIWAGLAGIAFAQILFTYAPFMNRLFHTAPVRAEAWLYIAATGLLAFAVVEFEKWIRFHQRPGGRTQTGS